ncbi:MAG: DUF779 domain-containing protein [Actinobacteria bacterium]|nr:DUF779 domain-containing protein [Actinomycetota bacterium]
MRVTATERARGVVERVAASGRTELMLVLGTGCCDSTAPFLYDHYYPGADAVLVGDVGDVPVFAPAFLARLYEDEALVVDAEPEAHADTFSLEAELGYRFTLRLPRPAEPAADRN